MIENKYCPFCKQNKSILNFGFDKSTKDGYRRICKDCNNLKARKYNETHSELIKAKKKQRREQNREIINLKAREYYKTHKEQINKSNKKYRISNKEKVAETKRQYKKRNWELWKIYHAEYYLQHKDELREKQRKYRMQNKESINEHQRCYRAANKNKINAYTRNRILSDKEFYILLKTRYILYYAVKFKKDSEALKNLIGCNLQTLRNHLEKTFKDGMSWDNYGKNGWVIDHVIPCACFDIADEEQKKSCFFYKNLQAIWAKTNSEKGDKLPDGTMGRRLKNNNTEKARFYLDKLIESFS